MSAVEGLAPRPPVICTDKGAALACRFTLRWVKFKLPLTADLDNERTVDARLNLIDASHGVT